MVLFSPGKRLLTKRRAVRPFQAQKAKRKHSFLVPRSRHDLTKKKSNPLTIIQNVSSRTFNILGTLSLAMTGLVFFTIQPPQQQVFANNQNQTILYQEFQEIGHFPMTQQVKQQELAQNKIGQYVVQSGDNLNGICLALNTDCEIVKEYSQLEYPYALRTGQVLFYKLR